MSVLMMIAPNSSACKGWCIEEFEGKRRSMPATGEWCNPLSNMCKKGVKIGLEGFENVCIFSYT